MRRPVKQDCFSFALHREQADGSEREYVVDARVSIGGGTIECTVSLDGRVIEKSEYEAHGIDPRDVMERAWDIEVDIAIEREAAEADHARAMWLDAEEERGLDRWRGL